MKELTMEQKAKAYDELYAVTTPINDAEIKQEREPISNHTEVHWQDVRERAAIAAMQGITSNSYIVRDIGSNKVIESMQQLPFTWLMLL